LGGRKPSFNDANDFFDRDSVVAGRKAVPIGTKIKREFPGHGTFEGTVGRAWWGEDFFKIIAMTTTTITTTTCSPDPKLILITITTAKKHHHHNHFHPPTTF
jgi:hypothetical protein